MILGLDIGSRSIELVGLEPAPASASGDDGTAAVVLKRRVPTTFDPVSQCRKVLDGLNPSSVVGTGYGRKLLDQLGLTCETGAITEIKAHALGAAHLFPQAGAVLDIGGQDTKAMTLSGGRVLKFEMNDRCAAGTGKFLEYTAGVFQIAIEDFGGYAMQGTSAPEISSICTVFAETEATSLMARGETPQNIALGLHKAIVKRTVNMLNRVGFRFPVVFSGGVAMNPCVRHLLAQELGAGGPGGTGKNELLIPEEPDMVGALGAALIGFRK